MSTETEVKVEEKNEVIELTDYEEHEEKTSGFRSLVHKVLDYLRTNSLKVEKDGTEILKIKLILFLILIACVGEIVLPLMVVGLFFKFRYSFVGRNEHKELNDLMDGASRVAQAAAQGFKNAMES